MTKLQSELEEMEGQVTEKQNLIKDAKAQIKKYKSAIEGEGFEPCVKDVFLAIDFLKPKTGTTVVSYGLGFRPNK